MKGSIWSYPGWGQTDAQWSAGRVASMPNSWARRLLDRWAGKHQADHVAANLDLLQTSTAIIGAQATGVPADANDRQLCEVAMQTAADMARRLDQRRAITAGSVEPVASPWARQWVERCEALALYAEALHWLALRGLGEIRARGSIAGFLRRVVCDRWWRRQLRAIHARAVETTARTIGLVHKRAGCYVSDESARRRQGQNRRNAAALESVSAVNEHAQDYTLAELAAKGPANSAIRRHELMTRIAGFELIAKECGHVAYFVTVTCPSRMHAFRSRPGSAWATEANPKHDGTSPDEAQRYLSKQWARFRAAADRAGLAIYGFRIAEPNHDGTPHWHALLFFPSVASATGRPANRVAVRLLRRYFLWNTDGSERGARKHRVSLERIDWNRGSAAGYVAKYVAKNIDGMHVEKDLYGNEALESSQRVEAWAATWRIRQFQQIGGAPVGVWRELRRLHPDQQAAAAGVALALDAVNVATQAKDCKSEAGERYTAATGWAAYCELQGGARVRRADLRLRVLAESTGELGRYGDVLAPKPVGVVTVETRQEHRAAFGIVPASTVRRVVRAEVESERSTWTVVPRGSVAAVLERLRGVQAKREALRPWSPVNNCTAALDAAGALRRAGLLDVAADPIFAPGVQRSRKLGRWFSWDRGRSDAKESDDGPGSGERHWQVPVSGVQ